MSAMIGYDREGRAVRTDYFERLADAFGELEPTRHAFANGVTMMTMRQLEGPQGKLSRRTIRMLAKKFPKPDILDELARMLHVPRESVHRDATGAFMVNLNQFFEHI